MRRLAMLLAAFVMSAGTLLATTAAPAQADAPSYPDGYLQGVYYDRDHCFSWGSELVQTGPWDFYICDYYSGFWFLHTFEYAE